MDNTTYLKKLSKLLNSLDRNSKNEILREIKLSLNDMPNATLESRFGPVEKLAKEYLEDANIPPSKLKWFYVGAKYFLIAFAVLVIAVVGLIYWLSQQTDQFDYADLQAPELMQKKWQSLSGVRELNIKQASIVIYGSSDNAMSFSCARDKHKPLKVDAAGVVDVFQNECLLRIPTDIVNINAEQSMVVLNNLASGKDITIFQTNFRIVDPSNYTISGKVSQCDNQVASQTLSGQTQLKLTASQCLIESYTPKR
ncbi:MAG: hypothetical protein KC426_10020 [Oceanospirillaceae bacterium]|nr:hypothetical protein [Oceanospirillaceae bacterium]